MNLEAMPGGLGAMHELGFDWGSLLSTAVTTLAPQAINVVAQRKVAKVYAKAGVPAPGQPTAQPAAPAYEPALYQQPQAQAGMPDWAKLALVAAAVLALFLLLRGMKKGKR